MPIFEDGLCSFKQIRVKPKFFCGNQKMMGLRKHHRQLLHLSKLAFLNWENW